MCVFWNALFLLSDSEIGKKSGIKKMHVINFKIETDPNMKFFDFGAFQKNAYAIMWKIYILHAFWEIKTTRIRSLSELYRCVFRVRN